VSHGETVLDLGSGAGFDCFLAAREVGTEGQVIGVDVTPEMVSKAREIVAKNGVSNVEFRLGEIGHLPVADESIHDRSTQTNRDGLNRAYDFAPVLGRGFEPRETLASLAFLYFKSQLQFCRSRPCSRQECAR